MLNSNVSNFLISAFTNVPQTSQKTSVVEGTQKKFIPVDDSSEGNDSFNFSSVTDVDKYNSCKNPEEVLEQLAKDGVVFDEPSYIELSYDEPSYDESVCDEIQDLDSIPPMNLPSVEDPYSYVSDNAFLNQFNSNPLGYVDDFSSNPFNSNSFGSGDDASSSDLFSNNPFGF